jgi:hypothetical protein
LAFSSSWEACYSDGYFVGEHIETWQEHTENIGTTQSEHVYFAPIPYDTAEYTMLVESIGKKIHEELGSAGYAKEEET